MSKLLDTNSAQSNLYLWEEKDQVGEENRNLALQRKRLKFVDLEMRSQKAWCMLEQHRIEYELAKDRYEIEKRGCIRKFRQLAGSLRFNDQKDFVKEIERLNGILETDVPVYVDPEDADISHI